MRKAVGIIMAAAFGAGVAGCGGGYTSGSGQPPMSPSNPSPSANGVVIVNVVAIKGAQSFSPNPVTLQAGQRVVWHNADTVTHRVVLNDRSIDTGDLRPGASSDEMTLTGSSGAYHCSIHPEMIGSINQPTDPSTDPLPTPY